MSAAPALAFQTDGLTPSGRGWRRETLLASMRTDQRDIDAAEARKLTRVTEWADLHRTDIVEEYGGVLDGDNLVAAPPDPNNMPILMSGVPVDEYCLAELSAALRTSHGGARSLVEDALELRERLPLLWGRVQAGKCPAWKARSVAKQTQSLSAEAARFVDRNVAPFAHKLSTTRTKAAVDAAILTFDPDRAAHDSAEAADGRGVWIDYEHGSAELPTPDARPDGTGRIEGTASIPDLRALDDTLDQVAAELKILGDESSHQVRRSKALGILADPQYALDITATADAAITEDTPRRRPTRARTPLGVERPINVHLHTSTQVARIQTSGLPHTASAISREAIEQWVADLAPGARVTVTPVVDLNKHVAVDAYEAPDHIRALAEERDHTCVFPYCTNRGRYDLDHITPYLDPDEGGPPAQTSNQNLAKLCRYHHRAKTHAGWTYTRVASPWDLDPAWPDPGADPPVQEADHDRGGPPAAYRWTSPMGHAYLVDGTGTYSLD